MTLIRCDSDCCYQKDGYCTNNAEEYWKEMKNISLAEGCIYYRKEIKKEVICLR